MARFLVEKCFFFQNEQLCMLCFSLCPFCLRVRETDGKRQANVVVTDSVASCSIFNSTNRIEPVFLAPFRLYCKLVRRPGQGCSSAPWAPCRMQHSYRSFTVHHGVWFWDSTRMQRRPAHCSVVGPVPEAPCPYFYHLLVTDSTIFHTLLP